MHGIAERVLVLREIVGQQAQDLEAVAHLEAQHGIALTVLPDLLDVGVRAVETAYAAGERRQASAEDDPLGPPGAGELLAFVVETLADARATMVGIDTDLHPVEIVAVGIMARGIAAAADLAPGMGLQGVLAVDEEGGAITDDGPIVFGHELAFGEVVDLAP